MAHCRSYLAVCSYSFVDKMAERVPKLRLHIRQACFAELQGFLADIRSQAQAMGEAAMQDTRRSQALEELGPKGSEVRGRVCLFVKKRQRQMAGS